MENFGQPMAREENGRKSDCTISNNPTKGGGARNLKNQKHLKKESIREPTFAEYLQLTKHLTSPHKHPTWDVLLFSFCR